MSILNTRNYGDFDSIKTDVKTLHDIINRQGTTLIVDCIAEHIGTTANKFHLTHAYSKKALDNILYELTEQTLERI